MVVQIQPDGKMPMELSRTRAMHYTWWNMMAFFELAEAVRRVPGAASLFQYVAAINSTRAPTPSPPLLRV